MQAICLFCKKNVVPTGRWNLRCVECKRVRGQAQKDQRNLSVHQREPAAVISPDESPNTKIFVDKFGKEVPNPGYNLEHDHFGWGYTGKKIKEKAFIG